MLNVGERFGFALKELKITNKEIAESFNISSQNISNLKKNDRLNDLISQIATKYNINLNWLVTGKGNYIISNENINNFQSSEFKSSIAVNNGGNTNINSKSDEMECDDFTKSFFKELCKIYKNDKNELNSILFKLIQDAKSN